MGSTMDCDGGLSREHYVSRALLEGLDLKVRGLPWQREEVARVSRDSLVAKILCRRHNTALSPLDAGAQAYFLAFERARLHASRQSLSTRNEHYLISGDALELWAMKTLASLYASRIEFKTPEHRFRDFEPSMEQLVAELSSPRPKRVMQLSIPIDRSGHEPKIGRRAVSIGPLVVDPPHLDGLIVRMHGLGLLFRFGDGARREDESELVRPDIIDLHGPERTSRIYLGWNQARSQGRIFELRMGRVTKAQETHFAAERKAVIDRLADERQKRCGAKIAPGAATKRSGR